MKKTITNKARYLGLKLTAIVFALLLFVSGQSWGQTNPTTGSLPYSFTGAASIPATMAIHRFGTSAGAIPTTRTTSDGNGDLPSTTTNNSGGYMIEGTSGADGVSLLASSSQSAGAIVVEVSTTGKTNISVSWVSWTKLDQTSYTCSMALQYRVGESGTWINVDNPSSSVYSTSTAGRANATSYSQTLPAGAENQSIVQLRWIYWISAGSSGSRDRLGIDEISVTGTSGNSSPTVTTQFPSSILTTTATGNGNITATGGVDPTVRGFCWDLQTNADPDIADSKVEETGTFTTGAFTGSITGLTAGTQYKVRAYATNSVGTSYGAVQTFYTLSNEPTNHAASFTATANSQTQIDLAFSAASTITNAAGYLILQRNGAAPTGLPTDATAYTVGNTIGDGTVAAIITNTADISKSITGLSAGTQYYFTLFPYNGSASTINYKTDGSVPSANATTLAALATTSEVSGPALGSQPNPTIISSLTTTDLAAVRVLDMDIYDYGVDTDPTKITQVTIKSGTGNTANWANTIQGVKLSTDAGSSFVTIGTPIINATSIVIPVTSGNLNIPNSTPLTLSLYVYLKSSGLTDNSILEFKVDANAASHGFTADATGSTFMATFASAPVSNQILVDVVATKLAFVQQPTNTLANFTMTPAVTVEALDANNNRDLDKTGSVSITSSGTMTGSITATLSSGFGTAGNIVHTITGNTLSLTAILSGLNNATSNNFNILSALAAGDILFLGYGTDDPDKFAFIAMNTIPEGTQISFTDNSWSGTVLASNENTGIYTVPAGGLIKGNIIQITGTTVTGGGTMTAALNGLAAAGDQILAYQGSSSNPLFITGVSSTGWLSSGSVSNNTSYLPSNLAINVNAVSFSSEEDNGYYNGPTTLANGALASFVCNSANWIRSATIQTFPSWSFTIGNESVVNTNATVQDLTIANNEKLTINAATTLTVNSSVLIEDGGSLIDNGNNASIPSLVEKNIAGNVSSPFWNWHFLSAPVANQAITGSGNFIDFSNNPANVDFYRFDPSATTNPWINIKDGSGVLNTADWGVNPLFTLGMGYLVAYNSASTAKTFDGTLNTGNTNITLVADKFNLIGNPFPSAINWTGSDFSGLASNYVWIYNENKSGGAGYETFNSGTIAPMQGFFIKSAAASSITLDNSIRTHNSSTFYKSSTSTVNELNLKFSNGNNWDEATIQFMDNASANNDRNDASKMYSMNISVPQVYTTISTGKKFVVNALPTITTSTAVAVGILVPANGNYSITAEGMANFSMCTAITLEDLKTNTTQNLLQNPVYNFTASTTDNANRFVLHFATSVGVNENGKINTGIYAYDNNIYVNANEQIKQIAVYNTMGQLIKTTNNVNGLQKISMNGHATGYYIVKVITDNNVYSEKVLVK
jgi:hypothetical protein